MSNQQGIRCLSVKHITEPHTQCYLNAKKDEKYCAMHLLQKSTRDFVEIEYLTEVEKTTQCNGNINEIIYTVDINNMISNDMSLVVIDETKKKANEKKGGKYVNKHKSSKIKQQKNVIVHEEKISTVTSAYQDSHDDLEIKLLILINELTEKKLPELIGPVYNDITLSEDDIDPITFDVFWTLNNNVKIANSFNKYYLFSYQDINHKIRCLTIFTVYNMINENNFLHPITMDPIPEKDLERAKILISLYDTKLNLFNMTQEHLTPEFVLKKKVCTLLNRLHDNDIYLEDKWFTELSSTEKLIKIINKTKELFSNNKKAIFVTNKTDTDSFSKIKYISSTINVFTKSLSSKNTQNDEYILSIKNYIVDEWEKMINIYDLTANSLIIWIIICGLSYALPEISTKYPQILEFDKN